MTLPPARDLAGKGIRVNAIAPGLFRTPMIAGMPTEVQESLIGQVLEPARMGEPREFGELVLTIVANRYLDTETIRLDAGIRTLPR